MSQREAFEKWAEQHKLGYCRDIEPDDVFAAWRAAYRQALEDAAKVCKDKRPPRLGLTSDALRVRVDLESLLDAWAKGTPKIQITIEVKHG